MITALQQPQLYTTTNLALFKVTSDLDSVLQFRVDIYDADSDLVITSQKYGTLPMITNGTSFNIAPLLASFIDYQLDTSAGILKEIGNIFKRYHVAITELYRNDSGVIVEGDTLFIEQDFYIWLASLGKAEFNNFDYRDFVASAGHTVKFLNAKPLITYTRNSDVQYLYLMSTLEASVKIDIYQNPATLIGSHTVTGIAPNKAYRLSVSPDELTAAYGDDLVNIVSGEFTDEFDLPFGSPARIDYYTVRLIDSGGLTISETRIFRKKDSDCRIRSHNIVFGNKLGGFDSVIFTQPKETVSSQKQTITSNDYQYNSDGDYTNIQDGVFNKIKVNISSSNTQTFTMVSEVLNDEMSVFIKALIDSDDVYIKLPTGELFPVNVSEAQYLVNKRYLNTNNSRATLNFTVVDCNITL